MRKWMTACTAFLALAWAGSLRAHHSYLMYATTPLWIKGSVVGFEHKNPHTIITIEDGTEDGQVRLWAVEGPAQAELDRTGIDTAVLPKVGDDIKFCAFPYKTAAELSRIWPGLDLSNSRRSETTGGASPQFVAGHVMVMPDGEMRVWEPHGVIGECMRSSDEQRQPWLRFLNSDARARRAWCDQRGMQSVQSNASLKAFVDEVISLIDKPCE